MAQALPGALRWLAEIEPLRQILAGTRAILYFEARADASGQGRGAGVSFPAGHNATFNEPGHWLLSDGTSSRTGASL
jgi:hypothetical protein